MRLTGLVSLGAGAGLMGADLRGVRGTDVISRSGGVVVSVESKRPRVVPVRVEYHERLWSALSIRRRRLHHRRVLCCSQERDIGSRFIRRRRVGPAHESTARLRATWLVACAQAIGLDAFMAAAGITCSQRLGDLVSRLVGTDEPRSVVLLS